MKKIIAVSALIASSFIFVPAAEKASGSTELSSSPQVWRQRQPPRYRRGARVVTRTRIVRIGFRRYREVVQYRYLPNGRVTMRVLSRTRI